MSYRTLEEERAITIENISNDIFKLEAALETVENLTPEGEILREDLLGLLHFESDSYNQLDALMNYRKKNEKPKKFKNFVDISDRCPKTIMYH